MQARPREYRIAGCDIDGDIPAVCLAIDLMKRFHRGAFPMRIVELDSVSRMAVAVHAKLCKVGIFPAWIASQVNTWPI